MTVRPYGCQGAYLASGSSSFTRPSSARRKMARAVRSFVTEALRKVVLDEIPPTLPASRRPTAISASTRVSLTTA